MIQKRSCNGICDILWGWGETKIVQHVLRNALSVSVVQIKYVLRAITLLAFYVQDGQKFSVENLELIPEYEVCSNMSL